MSAFATSPFVQSVNDVLFPIELFLTIFPILYVIFVPAQSASLQVSNSAGVISEESLVLETQGYLTVVGAVYDEKEFFEPESSIIETAPPSVEIRIADEARQLVLIEVTEERKKLLDLGARKLRQFCKERQIQGYSSVYNRKKLDGLVDFLIAQQVTSAQVVEFVEMLA
ncbi:MAG: hypothetical protein RMZ41_011840 [Nostoc sp. DedVER02]|uniref:hypothetical protein n=1 Tax=unclassified Nostoc TaxID=2593658 RepID=UPI002AD1D171|nr:MULTISPECIES: hypothetical protein [unclassified Nostoc]MDZ7989669.1 hypothetical protein [Nostoc sp. DedVER02]MDZ8113405.1 hypothetical protein [Nostoc sp. DedVER01b]